MIIKRSNKNIENFEKLNIRKFEKSISKIQILDFENSNFWFRKLDFKKFKNIKSSEKLNFWKLVNRFQMTSIFRFRNFGFFHSKKSKMRKNITQVLNYNSKRSLLVLSLLYFDFLETSKEKWKFQWSNLVTLERLSLFSSSQSRTEVQTQK